MQKNEQKARTAADKCTTADNSTSASLVQNGVLAEVPVRIQRSRQHKQVSPNGLPIVYVGRGTRWGNPFRLCKLNNGKFAVSHECDYQLHQITKKVGCDNKHYNTREEAAKDAIRCYSNWLLPYTHEGTLGEFFQSQAVLEDALLSLKNKNLSCWCKLDETCHADYLINLVAGIR
jgi:hypothetical protein